MNYLDYIDENGVAHLPNGITEIEEDAFADCDELTYVEIPDSVTEIGPGAFSGCTSLISIEIPDSVKKIGECAFDYCSDLMSVEIPDSVTEIGPGAFWECHSLISIEIPDGVTKIGRSAFADCRRLTCIDIPDSVTEIGLDAFALCNNLSYIVVSNNNPRYKSIDNCLIEKETDTILLGCNNSIIPDGVKKVGGGAFSSCGKLTGIVIPDSVTEIGDSAFNLCTSLKSIEIPDSVTKIGDGVFQSCWSLEVLRVPFKDPVLVENLLKGCDLDFSKVTLYVPVGTGYAFRHHEFFKQFKGIIAYNRIHKVKYVFFDTETTGLPEDEDAPSSAINIWPRMIQLSWITTDEYGRIIKENDHIIYPDGFEIPFRASLVNGISTEVAKEKGDSIKNVLESFMNDVANADYIVGHNVSFDKHVVGAELIRLGERDTLASKPSICTMKSTIKYCAIPGDNGLKYPSLQELHKKLFGSRFKNAHNALSDIRATLRCYFELKVRGMINE